MRCSALLIVLILCIACRRPVIGASVINVSGVLSASSDSTQPPLEFVPEPLPEGAVVTGIEPITTVSPHEVVEFAKTLIGVPYQYASIDPAVGFDCSGFITYVFSHFHVKVPRSSVDFTNVGREVEVQGAKEGDLILFTGTNDSIRIVGHMGIVTENSDTLKFIHSTSGRAMGVTISPLSEHYKKRLVKIVRIFEIPSNDFQKSL